MSEPQTTPKRPRKDEIMSVVKLLRQEAAKQRNYAAGDRKRAEDFSADPSRSDTAAYCTKMAGQHEKRAERWEKVAEWLSHG